jgi:hypothetical protein
MPELLREDCPLVAPGALQTLAFAVRLDEEAEKEGGGGCEPLGLLDQVFPGCVVIYVWDCDPLAVLGGCSRGGMSPGM